MKKIIMIAVIAAQIFQANCMFAPRHDQQSSARKPLGGGQARAPRILNYADFDDMNVDVVHIPPDVEVIASGFFPVFTT